jgi:RNA-directed DNA polymerase
MTIGGAEGGIETSRAGAEGRDQKFRVAALGASNVTVKIESHWTETEKGLMEKVVSRFNMMAALDRVVSNKGAPGVDAMPVTALRGYLMENWPRIKEELLAGRYRPQPVRRVEIPKDSGGTRMLGIPTVLDRLIQQALQQVLNPLFDPEFSESSYGFRPGRSAHQAVRTARRHVADGRRWVVDIDLANFFDRVNHDILVSRLARKVGDRRVIQLIYRYLQAGILEGGVVSPRVEGTPQGGPLSPLLSNILLDELDKELEKRGHKFVRYADDCNIYLTTRKSGERVMASVTAFLEGELKLVVNRGKSAVDRPWNRIFLSFGMTRHRKPRLTVGERAMARVKSRIRVACRRGRGKSIAANIEELKPKLRGWMNYFRHAEVKGVFEELDGWIRRKLRCILWRQWKLPRTREKNLLKLGLSKETAWKSAGNGRGPWWNSGAVHMNLALPKSYFDKLGLVSLVDQLNRFQRAT